MKCPSDPTKCAHLITEMSDAWHARQRQCSRAPMPGRKYCKQHAPLDTEPFTIYRVLIGADGSDFWEEISAQRESVQSYRVRYGDRYMRDGWRRTKREAIEAFIAGACEKIENAAALIEEQKQKRDAAINLLASREWDELPEVKS